MKRVDYILVCCIRERSLCFYKKLFLTILNTYEVGFNKIIFVIRKDIESDFRERIGNRVESICKERHRQKITQQEEADITGISSKLTRFESGTRIPTLVVLEKCAAALGKHVELRLSD